MTGTDQSPDNPLSSTTTVVVHVKDINDNKPRFSKDLFHAKVAVDIPVNSIVFWLDAHDQDSDVNNGQITYALTQGHLDLISGTALFNVHSRTGAVRLIQRLDQSDQRIFNITAMARDPGYRVTACNVVIEVVDVNRNFFAPYFPAYPTGKTSIQVREDFPIGDVIGELKALDDDLSYPDNDVLYYVSSGTGLGLFDVNRMTGKSLFYSYTI